REQQNALDKQLATQANYAAESGINAAFYDIEKGYITTDGAPKNGVNTIKADPTGCMKASQDPNAATYSVDGGISHPVNSGNGVTYSCLLVDLQPPNLQFNCVSPSTGHHMNFGTQDALTSLTIYWGSCSGNNSSFPPDTSTRLLPLSTWNSHHYPPVIQFSVTPTSSLSTQSNPTQYLIDNTTNVYMYPAQSGNNSCSTSGAGSCSQGQILSGDCNPGASRPAGEPDAKDYPCAVTLTGLGGKAYVIHYIDYYDTANIWVDGKVSAGGSPAQAKFSGEPQIDVTGKARNVLKRLQARLLSNNGTGPTPNDNDILPGNSVEAQNLCKRIQAAPATNDYSSIGSTYDGLSGFCNLSQ
ncbi:MAG: hypothetical protein ACREJM_12940, partial [Candidatus Saccharimonadales bacterium]